MKSSTISALIHAFEMAVVLGIVLAVSKYFPDLLPSEVAKDTVAVILGYMVALARKSDASPIPDYVNPVAKK